MNYMFAYCDKLTSLDVSNFNTGKVTGFDRTFSGCQVLTSLDVSNFDTSKATTMFNMFSKCYKLTSLDVSNFDTSNVTNMSQMFQYCQSLTSLDVSNWNTGKVTSMSLMFHYCTNLTSLDVSNWNTGKVTNMNATFYNCYLLTSLDVSNWNTGKVTNMTSMFFGCQSLTSLDVSNWDTSNVTTMNLMFDRCCSLTSLDVSNWDTSKVYIMYGMFALMDNLEILDLSNFNTTKVVGDPGIKDTGFDEMFVKCPKLKILDLSNFVISKQANFEYMFNDINVSLTDIGMLYCDFDTVEIVASLIPTTSSTTIWVGNHIDINGLPQYNHVTYKVYEVEDKLEVELSSPLLEGDRLEIIDGDLYHYHKCGINTFDGTENVWTIGLVESGWEQSTDYIGFYTYYLSDGNKISNINVNRIIYTNIFDVCETDGGQIVVGANCNNREMFGRDCNTDSNFKLLPYINYFVVRLHKDRLESVDKPGINNWLKANNLTVVYELNNPYYELVKPNVGLLNAEQGLYLNISDSVVPVVNHQDLCTIKLNYLLPNVQYKVKFKANTSDSIAINLGGTLVPLDVVEGWNEVLVTTPETLVDEYLKVNGSEGIKIQNVMVIDSDKDFDYFKGMNNTFDEIPVKNICPVRTNRYTIGTDENGEAPKITLNKTISKGKVVTVVGKVENNVNNKPIAINLYKSARNKAYGKNKWIFGDFKNVNTTKQLRASELGVDYLIPPGEYYLTFVATQYPVSDDLPKMIVFSSEFADDHRQIYPINLSDGATRSRNRVKTENGITSISFYTNGYSYNGSVNITADYNEIQLEEMSFTGYEPPIFYVNDEPIMINPDENGYFVVTLKADRDYADQIAIYIPDEDGCETGEIISVTDLMVFEGDILDCRPTTYVDPADTRYLVEYKSIGNPFGFGKNKLI